MITKLNNTKAVKRVLKCVAIGHNWAPHRDNLHRICVRCNKVSK